MNVYLYAVAALVFVLGCAGSYIQGRSDGTSITTAAYATRDLQGATVSFAKYREATDAARKKEAEWASAFKKTGDKFQRELDANATTHLAILADIDAKRLRDPGASCQASGSQTSATSADTGSPNAGELVLSATTGRFLFDQAAAADRTRLKLNSCIDLLESERQ